MSTREYTPSMHILPCVCFHETRTFTHLLPRDVYFHACTVYFHETCTLHGTSKHGPCKHITGMHCSIVMVPCKIMCGKMKLQLSSTVYVDQPYTYFCCYINLGHYLISVLLVAVLGGNTTFYNEVVFVYHNIVSISCHLQCAS